MAKKNPGLMGETARTVIIAVLIAFFIRTFAYEPFNIPSGSMIPTLLVGDYLFVSKFSYGYSRYSLWGLPITDDRVLADEPERGDVVVFTVARDPRDPGRICPVDRCPGKPTEEFVKRIVGLPGEIVEVRPDGTVRIDGRLLEAGESGDDFTNGVGTELAMRQEDNGRCHYQVLDDRRMTGAVRRVKVEADRYFMMGDNRDHSNDSRGWGTVRAAEFKGPALVLYWSWDYNAGWLELLNPMTFLNGPRSVCVSTEGV